MSKASIDRMVNEHGKETLDLFKKNQTAILFKYFGYEETQNIARACAIIQNVNMRDEFIEYMLGFGVDNRKANKIYDMFGADSMDTVKTNPFICMEVSGIGFLTCDRIARTLGIALESKERIIAATKFVLESMLSKGDLYFPVKKVMERVCEAYSIRKGYWTQTIRADLDDVTGHHFYLHEGNLMLRTDGENETKVSRRIMLLSDSQLPALSDIDKIRQIALKLNENRIPKLSDNQLEAAIKSIASPVSVITGGPGTGKSTITKMIIDIYRELVYLPITCMAPTGKAASRMTECTGLPAATIHKTLKIIPGVEQSEYDLRLLDRGLVIVDEVSMIDQDTMAKLVSSVRSGSTLILIGDRDQLPSVGRGDVLNQLIKSGAIPVSKLTEIFRQKGGSLIIDNAQKINRGDTNLSYDEKFQYIKCTDKDVDLLKDIYLDRVNKYGIDQVAVLCPLRQYSEEKNLLMVSDHLNSILQDAVNPHKDGEPEIKFTYFNKDGKKANACFRIGDRIMSWKNKEDVSNGDLGFIRRITYDVLEGERYIDIDWDNGNKTTCTIDDLEDIDLAYSMSIHKSQGTESKAIIMPFLNEHKENGGSAMYKRNLIYTGVTRAKEECILLGDSEAIGHCIKSAVTDTRNSYLSKRLKLAFEAQINQKISVA
ncbi:MAG: AAA family ATPase, partial [Erysipelotrichaceae bacterium]|nr:AAA family ATPase [Erysipelotrichaceae bacterium]